MANELQSLSGLFNQKIFRIPDYQRGYAWRNEQLVDFWDDLLNLNKDKYHYTGLLSLKSIESSERKSDVWKRDEWLLEKGYEAFYVVDGQQRLTTFSILLNEIIIFVRKLQINQAKKDDDIFLDDESLKNITEKYIFRRRFTQDRLSEFIITYLFGYEKDNPSELYLKYKIFEEKNSPALQESYYTKNLDNAKKFFLDNLSKFYEIEGYDGLELLYRKLVSRLMFNIHEIKDDYDVFMAFETMNNRGKKLTNLELLKNRLIYLTTLFDDKQIDDKNKIELRKNINETWKEIYHQLGRNKDVPLSDDDFLRGHWITYFRYSRIRGNDYINFLLNEQFSAKNVFVKRAIVQGNQDIETESDFENTEDEVLDIPQETIPFTVSKLAPNEISSYINSLKYLAKYWYYSFYPVESSFSYEEKTWIDKLNRIGIGHFRPLIVVALSKDTITQDERVLLFKAIERFIFVSFRIGGFNASYQSSVYYNKSREFLSDRVSLTSIVKDLNDTVDNDKDSAVSGFITNIKRYFNSKEGFYGWRALRYFLYEYELGKAIENKLEPKIDWRPFTRFEKEKVSIEHIFPQTPIKEYWQKRFGCYSEIEKKYLTNSLGNLLPLSQSVNSSLQNDGFDIKKKRYENGSHSEIEVGKRKEWTPHEIKNRGMNLLLFMENRWNITFSDDQKADLLNIPFVKNERIDIKNDNIITGDNFIEDSPDYVRLLKTVGITTFVEYYEVINQNEPKEIIKYFNDENWEDSSKSTKAYAGKAIFNKDFQFKCLNYIINDAEKISKYIKTKACQLLNNAK